ncbi:hypothetical protein D3C76_1115280 [compost metagenome]
MQLRNLACVECRQRRVRIELAVQDMIVRDHLVMRVDAELLFNRFGNHKPLIAALKDIAKISAITAATDSLMGITRSIVRRKKNPAQYIQCWPCRKWLLIHEVKLR